MRVKRAYFIFYLLISYSLTANAQKKLRTERFFGFHFDFHATAKDTIGRNFDTGLLDTFLLHTKPDFIQIDCKGHPGYSSYPTKVGYPAPIIDKDPMKIFRDATNKYDIALYMHYSGLEDGKAIRENPRWGRIKADGSIDSSEASYLGDYSKKLLIPQLTELIRVYGVDGVWIDGDCWTARPDYSPEVIAGFLKKTKLGAVPRVKSDPNYDKWMDYNREIYRMYVKNIVNELHRYKPSFQIGNNWTYSSMMPIKVDTDVDYLSGDLTDRNAVYNAAFQGRCFASQGKPWDLLSWGIVKVNYWKGIYSRKSLIQLKQEAAETMAMGGGFQVYYQQNRDASFRTLDVDAMKELSQFCRSRQPYCQDTKSVPQIGLWYSLEGWKKQSDQADRVYGWWSSKAEGLNSLLLDCQYSVEVLMDHTMKKEMDQYPIIVIPEWEGFNPEIKSQLLEYARNGGNVVIVGAKTVKEFQKVLDVSFTGRDTTTELLMGDRNIGGIVGLKTLWQPVLPNTNAEVIGHVYTQNDYRYATQYPIATINDYGKGKIAAVYMDISSAGKYPVFNKLIKQIIQTLEPNDNLLHVTGSDKVHVALGKKNGSTLIHLINSSGEHANPNVITYEELRPTPSLLVSLKANDKPEKVILQPEGENLNFKYKDNRIEIMIPPVKVYSIIEIVPDK